MDHELDYLRNIWAKIKILEQRRDGLILDMNMRRTFFAGLSPLVTEHLYKIDDVKQSEVDGLSRQIADMMPIVESYCLPAVERLGMVFYEHLRKDFAPKLNYKTQLVNVLPQLVHAGRYRHHLAFEPIPFNLEEATPVAVGMIRTLDVDFQWIRVTQSYTTPENDNLRHNLIQEEQLAYIEQQDMLFVVKKQ